MKQRFLVRLLNIDAALRFMPTPLWFLTKPPSAQRIDRRPRRNMSVMAHFPFRPAVQAHTLEARVCLTVRGIFNQWVAALKCNHPYKSVEGCERNSIPAWRDRVVPGEE